MKRGQSLVEIAIAAPLLLLMFLGVFEVGWAIRSQIILDTVAREGARYGAKPQTLVISGTQVSGFQTVVSHTLTSLANQLELDPETDAIIVSVAEVDTGQPCDPALRGDPVQVGGGIDYWPNCDCDSLSATTAYTPYVVLHPGKVDYAGWQYKWPLTTTHESRLDFNQLLQYAELNDKQNCAMMKTGAAVTASQDKRISVEVFYSHSQLLGAPLISNVFTDPIPMYSKNTFRIVPSRE